MRRKYNRALVTLLLCAIFFSLFSGFYRAERAEAAVKTLNYTLKKGKNVKIKTIINKSSLSKKKKKKAKKSTWKSKNKKIVKVYSGNKKIKALKTGTTYIKGYYKNKKKKKKLWIRVKIKVPKEETPSLTRMTSKGQVKGKRNTAKTAMIWYGIPYGASTADENRFRAPKDVEPWTGVRSATTVPQKAAQYSSTEASGYIGTEDCLYVNVYRPNTTTKNLPVLVYLHGGGNCSGTANVDFPEMAQTTNSVIVSVSYRVGAFGFLSHPALRDGTAEENSGNFTLLDIQKALQWVNTDIANFGGNSKNVTLSGFSGGARLVLMCLISPKMSGLFHKAIVLSGGFATSTQEEGEEKLEDKLAKILVDRGTYPDKQTALAEVEKANNKDLKELLQNLSVAELAGMYKSFDLEMKDFPHGFTDGVVIPKQGFDVIEKGQYNRVPIMLGTDATEFSSFGWNGCAKVGILSSSEPVVLTDTEQYLVANGIQYGSMLQSYFYLEQVASSLYADASHKKVFAFRMMWGTNESVTDRFYSQYVGAYHGQIRDFLLGDYKHYKKNYSPDAVSSKNKKGRTDLTAQMRSYVANFLLTGNPNGNSMGYWNEWTPLIGVDKVMLFDAGMTEVNSDMSSQMYNQADIFKELIGVTAEEDYERLTKDLFADRFFMPGIIPSYY